MSGRVLTVQEASVYTGRSPQFIRALIADHQVAATKVRGRWYVNARSLDAWAAMGSPDPQPPDTGYVIPAAITPGRRHVA